MIRGVIFDIDNTLTDFMSAKHAAVDAAVEMMIDAGLKAKKDEMVKTIFDVYWKEGIEDQRIFDKVLKKELGAVDYKILAAAIIGYRRAKTGVTRLYPHVSVTLRELLKMGVRTTALSDAPKLEVWLRIVNLGLHHYFERVITAEDVGARKPDVRSFRRALEVLGTRPGETIMVGDWADRDIAGAKKVGIRTAWAKYGDTHGTRAKESGADHELEDSLDLVDIIRKENESVKA